MTEEEQQSWDTTLEEWMMSEGFCCAAGMAQKAEGALYAAAPIAGEEGWKLMCKEGDYEAEILQEDDTVKKITVNETTCLWEVGQMTDMAKRPENGLWIAGNKYQLTSCREEEIGEHKVVVTMGANKDTKTAVVIATTKTQIIIAMTNEEKGQKPGNATKAILAFAEYLLNMDF
mmetsp:Transcript_120105/g.346984  ORF Transcript_120105/g.346984 Transcript_120105/m.346984 type:complete len:174 (-) Transcript_120105:202-723(-)